jgi:hypothetical protein
LSRQHGNRYILEKRISAGDICRPAALLDENMYIYTEGQKDAKLYVKYEQVPFQAL